MPQKLKLLPAEKYKGVNQYDPIKYYYWPIFGRMYRERVELALNECAGGERILEVGFGTGLAFPNLHDNYKEIHGIDLTADIDAVKSVFEPMGIPLYLKKGDVLSMPYYEDNFFDTVLMVSILEHLKPLELEQAVPAVVRDVGYRVPTCPQAGRANGLWNSRRKAVHGIHVQNAGTRYPRRTLLHRKRDRRRRAQGLFKRQGNWNEKHAAHRRHGLHRWKFHQVIKTATVWWPFFQRTLS